MQDSQREEDTPASNGNTASSEDGQHQEISATPNSSVGAGVSHPSTPTTDPRRIRGTRNRNSNNSKPSSDQSTQSCSSSSLEQFDHSTTNAAGCSNDNKCEDKSTNSLLRMSNNGEEERQKTWSNPTAITTFTKILEDSTTQNSSTSSLSLGIAVGIPVDQLEAFRNDKNTHKDGNNEYIREGEAADEEIIEFEEAGHSQSDNDDPAPPQPSKRASSWSCMNQDDTGPKPQHFSTNSSSEHSTGAPRQIFSRTLSQPTILTPPTVAGGPNVLPSGPSALTRQSSMTERVNKLRSSVFQRPLRLNNKSRPSISRSKSDIPRTWNSAGASIKKEGDETNHPNGNDSNSRQPSSSSLPKNKDRSKARSLSSSPISKYNLVIRSAGRDGYGRPSSLPTTSFDRSGTSSSVMGVNRHNNNTPNARRNNNHNNRRNNRGGDALGHVAEEDEGAASGDEDVLMMIAKARVKLEMQGLTGTWENGETINDGDHEVAVREAQTVLEELQQHERRQQQQDREDLEHQKMAAAPSGSSFQSGENSRGARSAASSTSRNGTASLPGAYSITPGVGSERLESFSHTSISRYSESAHMKHSPSHQSSQLAAFSDKDDDSDLDMHSISSGESRGQGMSMEIEFSQESFSNLNDGGDRKPAAMDNEGILGGSEHLSAATLSIGPDEIFDKKKPASTALAAPQTPRRNVTRTRRPQRPMNRSRSFAGVSTGGDDAAHNTNNKSTNYATLPPGATLSAPSTMSDDTSEASSTKQRRRQRRIRQRDHRRRHYSLEEETETKMPSKVMKDGSGESSRSQLVIAAEVVRSEEEVVEELREKVEKEILASMAKELNEMEASITAFSTDIPMDRSQFSMAADLSLADTDILATPSPGGERGRLLSRMSSLNTLRSNATRSQQSTPGTQSSGLTEPLSPNPASIQNPTRTRRLPNITPNQTSRLRSLNLSGASPAFLRRTPRRGKTTPQATSAQQARKARGIKSIFGRQSMPTLENSSLDEEFSSSSEDDNDQSNSGKKKRNSAPARGFDIVDALDVVPASPPTPRERAQSQPNVSHMLLANGRRPLPRRLSLSGGASTPILDQLRSMAGSSPLPENTTAVATESINTMSPAQPAQAQNTTASAQPVEAQGTAQVRHESEAESLPDLQPPPPPASERASTGGSIGTRMSVSSTDGRIVYGMRTTRRFSNVSTYSSAYSSACSSVRRQSEAGGSLVHPNDDGDHTEFNVVNDHHDGVRVDVRNLPGDWDLHQQMEVAELGHGRRLDLVEGHHYQHPNQQRDSYGQSTSVQAHSLVGATDRINPRQPQQYHEGTVIIYEDRLPVTWVTPIGLLVVGAVVLGLVLFAV